jgi:hypothetical protein
VVPDFLFLDREGNELGIIRSPERAWVVGSIVERPSGLFRVVEVFEPYLPDVDGVEAYVTVEPVRSDDQ